jgi:hypothetical protein
VLGKCEPGHTKAGPRSAPQTCEYQRKSDAAAPQKRSLQPNENEEEEAMPAEWEDPQLDRAQFASDNLYERCGVIAVRLTELSEAIRASKASAGDLFEFAELKDELVGLIDKIGEIGKQTLAGNPAPHLWKV